MNKKDNLISYNEYGNIKGKCVVLLHGWGQNKEMMDPIGKGLEKEFHIISIDLPGFGESAEPEYGYTIYDYFEVLDKFLDNHNIKNPILIGHSFGGRLAIVYASKRKVEKLILLSAPFKRSVKKNTLKVKILKILKKVPIIKDLESYMKTKIGSEDYRKASPIMRTILVNVVNEDLTEYLKIIDASTLIIWGSEDAAVSIFDAREMESIMKDAGLVIYEGCTHYAYLERINQTIKVINSFISEV